MSARDPPNLRHWVEWALRRQESKVIEERFELVPKTVMFCLLNKSENVDGHPWSECNTFFKLRIFIYCLVYNDLLHLLLLVVCIIKIQASIAYFLVVFRFAAVRVSDEVSSANVWLVFQR